MKIDARKAFNKKRLIPMALVVVCIALLVVFNPGIRNFFLAPDVVKIDFRPGVDYDFAAYKKEMLMIDAEGISALDKSGRGTFDIVHSSASPMVSVRGKYIMIADSFGKTVSTYEREKAVNQITTENEILCAKVNKNGYIVVATDELGFKGMVTLYDKNGSEIYKWHSGNGYIGAVDISSNNKIAVSQIVTDKETVRSRIIIIDYKSKNDPKTVAEIDGIVAEVKYRENGRLSVVSDKSFRELKKNGKTLYTIDFEGKIPLFFNIDNERNLVFTFDSGLNSTIVESYSSRGKLRGSYTSGEKIQALDVNGECIVLAEGGAVLRLDPKGHIKKRIELKKDIRELRIFSDRNRVVIFGGSGAEIIKTK